jgi:hypothetical protein
MICESTTTYSLRDMNSTNTDFNAKRAQRDQGTRDPCNPDFIRLILATTQNTQRGPPSTGVGQFRCQTDGQNAGK